VNLLFQVLPKEASETQTLAAQVKSSHVLIHLRTLH